MKKCSVCGCEIINGVNGCTMMSDCFSCHVGYPKYPAPVHVNPFSLLSVEDLDKLEDRCLGDCTE